MTKARRSAVRLSRRLALSEKEFLQMKTVLGRTPSEEELAILATFWGERSLCKTRRNILESLSQRGGRVVSRVRGQKTGFIHIGDNIALAMSISTVAFHSQKRIVGDIKSSAVGTLGKLVASGATPAIILWSGDFGENGKGKSIENHKKVLSVIQKVARAFELPITTSQVTFQNGFGKGSLVVMAVGITKVGHRASATVPGEGDPIFLIGARTGRRTLNILSQKRLLAAVSKLSRKSYLMGTHNIDKGGMAAALADMGVEVNRGLTLHIGNVRCSGDGWTESRILLSETPGRMMVIVNRGFEKETQRLFRASQVPCVRIGVVNSDEVLKILKGGKELASIPLSVFAEGKEILSDEFVFSKPERLSEIDSSSLAALPVPKDMNKTFLAILKSPNVVGNIKNLSRFGGLAPSSDTAPVEGTDRGVVVRTNSQPRFSRLNARIGGKCAVAGAVRKVVCRGAEPVATGIGVSVDNLTGPEELHLFRESISGIGEACQILSLPVMALDIARSVTNTSLPWPTVGAVGLARDARKLITPGFKDPDDFILMLGSHRGELGGSEYLKTIHNCIGGTPPVVDLEMERRIHELLLMVKKVELIKSACDISHGGLATALAQCLIAAEEGIGARIHMSSKIRDDELLFGETQGVILVTVEEDSIIEIERVCMRLRVPCTAIGRVTDTETFTFNDLIAVHVNRIKKVYSSSLERLGFV